MRCIAYCTATYYHLKPLMQSFGERFKTALYRDVVHVEVSDGDKVKDLFFFSYGTAVFWGLSEEEEQIFLKDAKEFEIHPIESLEVDKFSFSFGETFRVSKDEIVLPTKDVLSRLAVSHGLAQSIKLGNFETVIHKTFTSTKYIPEDLAKQGRISLSRREIRRKMGELFIERNSINLHFDVLDTPEFFWEYPELEPIYKMIANYLDVETRVDVLNKRLGIVHELFEMLGNELNHQHSSRLELTIICLIIIEVVLSLMRDVFQWI